MDRAVVLIWEVLGFFSPDVVEHYLAGICVMQLSSLWVQADIRAS